MKVEIVKAVVWHIVLFLVSSHIKVIVLIEAKMKEREYEVSFRIKGTMIGDDAPLSKSTLKRTIELEMDAEEAQDYYNNREIDCKVSNIKINKINKIKDVKKVYDNLLPMKIEIGVYYTEDDEGYITHIDEDSMREEFDSKLKELKALPDKK
jgi:hypothetical protein